MDNNENAPKNKKSQAKVIIAILGFAVFILGATLLYQSLSQKYLKSNEVKIQEEQTKEEKTDITKSETTEITLADADGNEVRISDMKGKPTIVNFWASWCPYCIEEMPYFQTVYDEKGEDVNFMMVNVTDGSRETVEVGLEFIKTKGFTFPVYFDTNLEASTYYNIYALPTTVFLDKDGQETGRVSGKMSEEDLRMQIEKIME